MRSSLCIVALAAAACGEPTTVVSSRFDPIARQPAWVDEWPAAPSSPDPAGGGVITADEGFVGQSLAWLPLPLPEAMGAATLQLRDVTEPEPIDLGDCPVEADADPRQQPCRGALGVVRSGTGVLALSPRSLAPGWRLIELRAGGEARRAHVKRHDFPVFGIAMVTQGGAGWLTSSLPSHGRSAEMRLTTGMADIVHRP